MEKNGELEASMILKIVCFFIPIAGLIIYACNVSTNRKYANQCGKASLIGLITPVVIMIAISLLGGGIYFFNSTAQNIETINEASDFVNDFSKDVDTLSFNSQFLQYEGKISGTSVKSLINVINKSNNTNKSQVTIKVDGETLKNSSSINVKSKYQVTFKENSKGIINQANITEIN